MILDTFTAAQTMLRGMSMSMCVGVNEYMYVCELEHVVIISIRIDIIIK